YRPGHADYTFDAKYGFRDYRGGGRSSGRETIGRVAAGAIAVKVLEEMGISFCTYTRSIGPVTIETFDCEEISNNAVYMPDAAAATQAKKYLEECMSQKNSAGGVIECRISHVPAGIGDPVFNKLDANLARAIMSIGAVKGVEIGDGFAVTQSNGLENNDEFFYDEEHQLQKHTNHAGGILGGISDGSEIILRAAVKPTASISSTQHTVNKNGENIEINIKGRHDPVIVPRAVVVVESMAAITILDSMLMGMGAKLENLIKIYG
ncbi:MAG: chorismate synthase, partial [Clostridiales bacterium]|nr:chorismate synthase [Clostridiales bacterium]